MRLSLVAVAIVSAAASAACARGLPEPTFNKDIAPIVFASCAPCHRPGGEGPFPLLSYGDAVTHADAIAHQTASRHMPPWLPERGEFPIVGERRLRPEQIDAIQRWAKGRRLEGHASDLPKAPAWPEGWALGRPDLEVAVARPYGQQPGGDDVYRNLVIRSPLKSAAWVRAVEFRTNGAPIHHAVIRVDRTSASRRRDGEDGRSGFEGMSWQGARDPDGHFIGWAPGRGPIVAPEGMPWRLDAGADLVIEVHLIPSRQAAEVRPSVGLFFTTTPPAHAPLTVTMGTRMIDIPAGAREHVVTDTYTLSVPVDLMSVYPHAHYLGKDMRLTATPPNGAARLLLHIPQWSFHWQQDYRYAAPIPLPAGTQLQMRYTFDNSEGNPDNPTRPPVRVRLGPKSTDEMAQLGLQVMPASTADAARLAQEFDDRDLRDSIAVGEARVREEPDNVEYRAFLGASYVEAGRFTDAMPHLEAAIRLDPNSADAHNDLGTALMELGRLEDAIRHLQRAAALAPKNEVVQFNLGNAQQEARRPAEAAAAYQRALAINPDFPDAHANLGAMLLARGRVPEALRHFERAADIQPNSAVMHTNLAGALAAAGRYVDAMRHVRQALALRPDHAPAIETFKRLQAMGIR